VGAREVVLRRMGEQPWDTDWCICPGETLLDWMEENHLSTRVVAVTCRLTEREVDRLLDGKIKLTPRIAKHLERGTLIPARLWLNLERAYRDGLARGKTDASEGRVTSHG
jgi:plasmid maintenance system antidote protein VapI